MGLSETFARRLRDGGGALAIEARGQVLDWARLRAETEALDVALNGLQLEPGSVVGVLGRNHPRLSAAFLGVMATGRCAASLNAFQPLPKAIDDAITAGAEAIVVEEGDLAALPDVCDVSVLVLAEAGVRLHAARRGAARPRRAGDIMLASTSGTTGRPKQIPLAAATLERALREIAGFNRDFGDLDAPGPDRPPLIQYSPLAHIAGMLTLARGAAEGRGVVLLEKFDPAEWVDVVRRHRPRTTGLPPAMMKMVLQAAPTPQDLQSLVSVWSGTAPIDPDVEGAFTARYGLPVLGNYGATEFCGAVARWGLEEHHRLRDAKASAVGRIPAEVALARVRDPASGDLLGVGEVGVLELRVHRIGSDWLQTTDLAALDVDGFLYLHGRADEAINRGGFKVLPDQVAAVFKAHPDVSEAVVLGLEDSRLGQVPVVVVEAPGALGRLSEPELIAFARARLTAYQTPVSVKVVEALPRTSVMKVDHQALRAMFTPR